MEMPPPDRGFRILADRVAGHSPGPVDETPCPHEGADADVERSFGGARESPTSFEQCEKSWLDLDRRPARPRVNP